MPSRHGVSPGAVSRPENTASALPSLNKMVGVAAVHQEPPVATTGVPALVAPKCGEGGWEPANMGTYREEAIQIEQSAKLEAIFRTAGSRGAATGIGREARTSEGGGLTG